MDKYALQMLDDIIALIGQLRDSLKGQNEQYERDALRQAQENLRSARSRLEPKVSALAAAKQRDGRA